MALEDPPDPEPDYEDEEEEREYPPDPDLEYDMWVEDKMLREELRANDSR